MNLDGICNCDADMEAVGDDPVAVLCLECGAWIGGNDIARRWNALRAELVVERERHEQTMKWVRYIIGTNRRQIEELEGIVHPNGKPTWSGLSGDS